MATDPPMVADPPPDVWVDERVVVRPSGIEGRGLFTIVALPSGTVVMRLGGRLVSSVELAELFTAAAADPEAVYIDTITVDEDAHLVLPLGTAAHYANHCCEPNVWHVGPYELATARDVEAGEELTIDYATSSGADGFVMACSCGVARCRGTITSDDWRLPELQARYAGHWTPALNKRIGWVDSRRRGAVDRPNSAGG
jgi:SET domain-containing protein